MDGEECAVAIVAQNCWHALARAEHDIEIAVGFNVHGPCAGITSINHRLRQLRLRSHVCKRTRAVLPHQANATRPCQSKISLEVIVEVELGNTFRLRRSFRSSARKWEMRTARKLYFFASCHCQNWRSIAAQLNGVNPIPVTIQVCYRLRMEADRCIGRRRFEDRRFHPYKVIERLSFFPGGSLDRPQA